MLLTLVVFMGTLIGWLGMPTGAKYMKAGMTTPISSTYPIWILPIAQFMLGETVQLKSVILPLLTVAGLAAMMIGA